MRELLVGLFRIDTHRGRVCLVDPQGSPFFSLGIVHAGAYAEGEGQALFHSKYAANWTTLAAKIAADFADWGFNTAGYHRRQYIDRTVSGSSILKQGLIQADESPYKVLIEQV